MKKLLFILVILAVFLGYNSVFVVSEGQRGLVLRFQRVNTDAQGNAVVYGPGLHFKAPFVDSVRLLDARLQSLEGEQDRFVTSEKKDLIVDSYVKWQISDFGKFYDSTNRGNMATAESLLKNKINNGLRSEFGTRTITDIVSGERSEVMADALKQVKDSSRELGIDVVDVRVKQINLPTEISNSIYDRMRAERNAVAKKHRSEGKEKAEVIRADIDNKVTVLLADAERKARTTRGDGDAVAADIYAKAYDKDPEFFSFIRTLEAYKKSFNGGNDVLVLKPDGEFFRYMKDADKKK
ncbi:protease modulator HflC [Gallaecimonas pentaromativorans]|uniref:Protein HflC n=1 Tax=Gallaecimonas pentaromativorans TaxID=584787 RepID=A0A3N1P2V3_9GAMM|nr:protease modulator HflC [Gallaecimonas pentaromativorans]ROQ22409.1 protease FtsH subunit HflC [Gallaecimonas pentaromativorans]